MTADLKAHAGRLRELHHADRPDTSGLTEALRPGTEHSILNDLDAQVGGSATMCSYWLTSTAGGAGLPDERPRWPGRGS